MAAWRCPKCAINYPTGANHRLNRKCPRCSSVLSYYTGSSPDDGWADGLGWDLQSEAVKSGVHPVNMDTVGIIYRDNSDTLHVSRAALAEHYGHLESGDVVRIGGKHYEILGYDHTKNEWWVQRMEFEEEQAEIDSLPVTWERHEIFHDPELEGWALFEYPPPEGDA